MSERYRYIKLAFGIALFLFLMALALGSVNLVLKYQASQSNDRDNAREYYQANAHQGPYSCRAVMVESGVLDWLSCLVEAVSAESGEQQAYYDLKAQQDMAAWAFGMLIVTIWLAVITLIGVGFVWKTLVVTQNAGAEAIAAVHGVERAWLTVKSAEIKFYGNIGTEDGGPDGPSYTITINWTNTGRSPAKNVNAILMPRASDAPGWTPDFDVTNVPAGSGIVGPDRDFAPPPIILEADDVKALFEGRNFLFLYSRVEYRVMGQDDGMRYTEITARVGLYSLTDPSGESELHIGLTPVGPQNTAT